MNIVQKAVRWALEKSVGIPLSLTDPKGSEKVVGGTNASGRAVTTDTAMQQSTVWSCVRVLAETIGAMPMAVYEKKNGNAIKVDGHPVSDVLGGSPNADMTSVENTEALITNLGLGGNTYAFREARANGDLLSVFPIPYDQCKPYRDTGTGEITFKVLDRGKWETYPQEKIWHVKGFGGNGLIGFSPISNMRQAIGLALATEEFGARFFSQGAKPSGFVSIPEWLKPEQREVAKKAIDEKYAGLNNAQRVQLLEGGMTYTAVTMPLEDAQFLETRGFQRDDICGIYRVPPHMVGNLARSTNNNIEQQALEFVMFTLMPYFTRIEKSALKWLFKPADRAKYFLRFNFEGLLRADAEARSKLYTTGLQNGYLSRNEVRALENMNRVDGLDDYTVQTNMTPVDKLAAIVAAQIAKPAPAAAPEKSGNTFITPQTLVQLPEKMAHDMKHTVSHPDIDALAAAIRDSGAATEKTVAALAGEVKSLAKDLLKPREAVFNDKGEPIGTRIVDTLH